MQSSRSQNPSRAVSKHGKFLSASWMAWMISPLLILADFTQISFAIDLIFCIFMGTPPV